MDTEKLKSILNRIPYILVVICFFLYLGWDYYEFSQAGANSPLFNKAQELDGLETQVIKLQKKSKQAEKFYQTFEKKKEELRTLAQELNSIKATLSEELDVPAFIKTVVTEAKRVGLKVRSLAPLSEVKKAPLCRKAVSI